MAPTRCLKLFLCISCWIASLHAIATHSLRLHGAVGHLSAVDAAETHTLSSDATSGMPATFAMAIKEQCEKQGNTFPTTAGCGSAGEGRLYKMLGFKYLDDELRYVNSNKKADVDAIDSISFNDLTKDKPKAPIRVWSITLSTKHCIGTVQMRFAFQAAQSSNKPWVLANVPVDKGENHNEQSNVFFKVLNARANSKTECPSYLFAKYLQAVLKEVCMQGGSRADLNAVRSDTQQLVGYKVWPRYGFNGKVATEIGTAMVAYLKASGGDNKALTWLESKCKLQSGECTSEFELHAIFDPSSDTETREALKTAWNEKGYDVYAWFPLQPDNCISPDKDTDAGLAWALLDGFAEASDKHMASLLKKK